MKYTKVRKGGIEISILKSEKNEYLKNGWIEKKERQRSSTKENIKRRKKQGLLLRGYHYD